jgi:hypothetical protein
VILSITKLCQYAECHVLFIAMLNVVMLCVVMLCVVMLCVVMLSVVVPSIDYIMNFKRPVVNAVSLFRRHCRST